MGIIDAYIPMDRRIALARGESLPDRTSGAVLFADISGFTRFNHAIYQELGSQLGAEELTQQVNRVYGELIGEVHRYGGSVISFGGDAITCWFNKDNGRRATACALDMQAVMKELGTVSTPTGKQFELGIKVSVTAGNARRFLVGQPNIQRIEVLAGEILDRMAAAEKQLKSGDVVVGSEVMGRLGNQAIVQEWRKDQNDEHYAVVEVLTERIPDQPWASVPDLNPEVAREWLLPPVSQRLLRGEGEYIAELRSAVAAFIKFEGLDYDDDESAGDKLDAYIGWVQRILTRYEGFLMQVNIGDKGSYYFAAFGARVAHEDDVDRALGASLELMTPPDELNFILNTRVGITRGLVRVGAYGAPNRRTYGVQGSDVNIAAKFMEHASPGQILTSNRIKQEAGTQYEFEALEPIHIKDFDEPFSIYLLTNKLVERTTDILGRSIYPIVGREVEKSKIVRGLHVLLKGQNTTVVIEGDAGIGKSRLVEYAIQKAIQSNIQVLVGAGDDIRKSSLYYAWQPIFSRLLNMNGKFGEPDSTARKERRAQIMTHLDNLSPDLSSIAPLLNEVLPLDIPENDLTRQMTGEVRASNIRELLVGLLSAEAKSTPYLLVIEDAHWLDSASWKMVQTVHQEVHPLFLIIAHRPLPDPIPSEYTELMQSDHVHHLVLDLFTQSDVNDFICDILEVKKLPQPVFDLVYEKAEGNPLFSEELIYSLRDAGLIKVIDDEGQISTSATNLMALDFPDTSQDIIRSRIDRLKAQEQLALKVASVIGRTFIYHILHDIHPVEIDKSYLNEYLDNFERLALTQLISTEPALEYRFKHIIIQEVAYNLMLYTQRRDLHQAIAEWYETNHAEDLAQVYPLLAHHWNNTENASKAVEFLEKAGKQAVRNFANREAVIFLDGALRRVDESGLRIDENQRAEWELLIGEAYVNLAQYIQGRQHIEAGLELSKQPIPSGRLKQYTGVLGQVLTQVLHRLYPNSMIGRKEDQRDILLAASRACERLSEVYYMANETALSLYSAFRTLNLAEMAGPSPELARGYATVGAMIGFIPIHRMANTYLQRALRTVEQTDDLNAQAWVEIVVAFYYAGVGNWDAAIQLLEHVVEISERLGDQRRREDGLGILFAINYFQGNFQSSASIAEDLITISRRRGAVHSLAFGLQGKAYARLHQGQFDETMEHLHELQSLMLEDSKITDEALMIEMYGLLCLTQLRKADIQKALDNSEHAIRLCEKATPSNFSSFSGFAGPACVYLSLWERGYNLPDVEKSAAKAIKILKKFGRVFPIGQPRAHLYRGWQLWLAGKHNKAYKAWQESLSSGENLKMKYEQGLAHFEIGRHLPEDSQDRKSHLAHAQEIFTKLGASFDLARINELLSNT
jgi:predicted ATPase/class 3 adenylate cyclase